MNKIAFPTNGNNLDAEICKHFGRANNFLIYDLNDKKFKVEVNPESEGKPIAPPDFLNDLDVSGVVCSGLGKKAIDKFLNHEIKVYKAEKTSIKDNLKLIEENKLKENDQSC